MGFVRGMEVRKRRKFSFTGVNFTNSALLLYRLHEDDDKDDWQAKQPQRRDAYSP